MDWQRTGADIYISELANPALKRLTYDTTVTGLAWKDASDAVVFSSGKNSNWEINEISIHGGPKRRLKSLQTDWVSLASINRKDDSLLYYRYGDNCEGLHLAVAGEKSGSQPLAEPRYIAKDGSFSPDGTEITYATDEAGFWKVSTVLYPGQLNPRIVSAGGGIHPVWSRDGKQLFFISLDRKTLLCAAQGPDSIFRVRVLFPLPKDTFVQVYTNSYDVSPEGRFLIMKATSEAPAERLVVETYWSDQLRGLFSTSSK